MRSSAMRSVMSCAPHRLARGVATVARHARRAAKKGQTRWSGLVNFSAGALDRIRTCGFLLRRQTLYPLSYKGTAETLYAIMAEMAKQTEGLHDRRNKALAGVSDPGETMGT